MIGSAGGSSVDDSIFFYIQIAVMIAWVLAFATVPLQRRLPWLGAAAIAFAALTEIVLPIVWNVGFPAWGLGKLRSLLGAAFTLVGAVLSCLWAVRHAADAIRPRWPAARPFVGIVVVGLVLWVVLY